MPSFKRVSFAALGAFACSLTVALPARADEPASREAPAPKPREVDARLVGQAETTAQMNPIAAGAQVGAYYRRVFSRDWRERSYIQAGAGIGATPSFVAPKVHVELMPHP